MKVATLKTPAKKKAKWPWVLLILFLIFVLGPIVTFYALFYDASSKRVILYDDVSLLNVGNRIIVDSLDPAPTEHVIDVKITEQDIDNMLYVAMGKIQEKVKFVKKAYMYAKGSSYNFFLDVDGVIIKSRVKVSTNMEISEDGNDFVFKVKDVAVGRVGGILTPAKWAFNRFITPEKVEEVLAASGLSLRFDADKFAIVYPKVSLIADLDKLTGSQDIGLYFNVMETIIRQNMMDFQLTTDNFIDGVVDLTKLETNDLVTDDEEHIHIHSEQVQELREKLVNLIEAGYVDPSVKEQPIYAFNFLFGGWDYLGPEGQAALADVDFSYVDIENKQDYKGFDLYDAEAKLVDKMKETVNANKLLDKTLNPRYKELCTISEADINDYIAGRSIVGYSSLLSRNTPEGYKVNYITVENFYMNIYKNADSKYIAEMVCKIDVNGYTTSLTLETEMPDGGFADNKLTFEVKDTQFGESDAENIKEDFFGIMTDAINNEGDNSLSVDKENYTISIDFTSLMDYARNEVEEIVEERTGSHQDLSSQFSMDNMEFEIIGNDRHDEGAMKLVLKEAIDY